MRRYLLGYATVDIRKVTTEAEVTTTYIRSTMEHKMENLKLGLKTIPDRLSTKGIQLTLNFLNKSGN